MSIRDFEILRDAGALQTIAHEERLAMIGLLAERPMTGAAVAARLDMPVNRAHYHLKRLLDQGLIREVGRGRKRWKEERFFSAVARHFLVDPALGLRDRKMLTTLHHSLESIFLTWRLDQLLKLDLKEVAARVVHQCVRVQPGETVLVMFGRFALDLAETILVELEAVGAHGVTKLWSRNSVFCTLDRHTPESLEALPFLPPEVDERIDAVIFISSNIPEGDPPNEEQQAKLPMLLQSVSHWQRSVRRRGVRYVELGLPFRREFEFGQVTPEDAINIFWNCLVTDTESIHQRGAQMLERFTRSPKIVIRGPESAELEMELDLDHVLLSDGVISSEDIAAGRTYENLPAGCLSIIPIPETVNGVLRADYSFWGGQHYPNPELRVEKGRIVELETQGDTATLRNYLARASGDANLVAEFSIGLNSAGRGPTGKAVLDGCLEGTVTVTFGNNELLGGTVRSTINLLFPSCSTTVQSGEDYLIVEGMLA